MIDVFSNAVKSISSMSLLDHDGESVLHKIARLHNQRIIQSPTRPVPASQRLPAVTIQDLKDTTVFHHMARSGKGESVQHILSLFPVSERLLITCMQCRNGRMSQLHAVTIQDLKDTTVFHHVTRPGRVLYFSVSLRTLS